MRKLQVLGIDAGGTMTDTLLVDVEGNMIVGKAATTPHDESIGFYESFQDALQQWDLNLTAVSEMQGVIYSGTTMINALLQRKGARVGLLVTKGMEDYLIMERGCQSYLGYHHADRLHAVTHVSNTPLIPRRRIKGIGGRLDLFGSEIIPLYEHEVVDAVQYLLDQDVQSICICFMHSYVNADHEIRAADIAAKVLAEKGKNLPIYISSFIQPVWRESARLNCTVIEAYAADSSRKHLAAINQKLHDHGYHKTLQIMQAHGGVVNYKTAKAFKSMISGPIGGVIGARYVSQSLGLDNMICTDMGGTSFDVGLITAGTFAINPEADLARFKLNLPMVAVDSIGAGTGTIIKVDPATNHIQMGPESVGSYPGPACFGIQSDYVSICDCDVITGIINPDYYLGGKVKLDIERAQRLFKQKVADPLKMDLYEAAAGMIDLVESQMRDFLYAMILGRGLESLDYHLIAYGGSGPMHAANYCKGLNFKGILVPSWAPAFSAFGCTCADHTHRYDRSVLFVIPFGADAGTKEFFASLLAAKYDELKNQAVSDILEEGYRIDQIVFKPYVRMMYSGQLDALEIEAPSMNLTTAVDIDQLIFTFESLYERVYTRAAKFEQAGYQATEVVLLASVPTTQPKLQRRPLEEKKPSREAFKGRRQVFWEGYWQPFDTWEMDRIVPGNVVDGPAIIEHPATTYVVPPDYHTMMDGYKIFWLKH